MYKRILTIFGTWFGLILTNQLALADQVISFKNIPSDIVEYQ